MKPAKQIFLALGGLLIIGDGVASAEGRLASAEGVNRLEPGTHDLAEMKTLKGVTVAFDPTKITKDFTLPRPPGGGTTNIIGLAGGPPGSRRASRKIPATHESESVFYPSDVAGRGSGVGEGFSGFVLARGRTLGLPPIRGERRGECRRPSHHREGKRGHQQRCDQRSSRQNKSR